MTRARRLVFGVKVAQHVFSRVCLSKAAYGETCRMGYTEIKSRFLLITVIRMMGFSAYSVATHPAENNSTRTRFGRDFDPELVRLAKP